MLATGGLCQHKSLSVDVPRLPFMRKSLLIALLIGGIAAPPLAAQTDGLTRRVDRLESQVRAVQRKVFPGGEDRFFEAEIKPEAPAAPTVGGTPATAPIADVIARVSALEKQLAALTDQTEQNAYAIRQLDQQVQKMVADAKAAAPAPVAPPPVSATQPAAQPDSRAAAIVRPDTGDAAEDGYLYGYRLWEAGLYPEAQAALKAVADAHPKHRRASFARNLLGRAYMDEGKLGPASLAFYDNYEKDKAGERAPDSLYFLGVTLTQMKKPKDACKVYDELQDAYGAKLSASLTKQVAAGRAAAKCG
jgi:TolA-binding protein